MPLPKYPQSYQYELSDYLTHTFHVNPDELHTWLLDLPDLKYIFELQQPAFAALTKSWPKNSLFLRGTPYLQHDLDDFPSNFLPYLIVHPAIDYRKTVTDIPKYFYPPAGPPHLLCTILQHIFSSTNTHCSYNYKEIHPVVSHEALKTFNLPEEHVEWTVQQSKHYGELRKKRSERSTPLETIQNNAIRVVWHLRNNNRPFSNTPEYWKEYFRFYGSSFSPLSPDEETHIKNFFFSYPFLP